MFVWVFCPTWEFFTHMETSPFPVKGLQILTYSWNSWALSRESSLACHTYFDTGHLFIMVISEDPWRCKWYSKYFITCFLKIRKIYISLITKKTSFSCLFGGLRPSREFFNLMETLKDVLNKNIHTRFQLTAMKYSAHFSKCETMVKINALWKKNKFQSA